MKKIKFHLKYEDISSEKFDKKHLIPTTTATGHREL